MLQNFICVSGKQDKRLGSLQRGGLRTGLELAVFQARLCFSREKRFHKPDWDVPSPGAQGAGLTTGSSSPSSEQTQGLKRRRADVRLPEMSTRPVPACGWEGHFSSFLPFSPLIPVFHPPWAPALPGHPLLLVDRSMGPSRHGTGGVAPFCSDGLFRNVCAVNRPG